MHVLPRVAFSGEAEAAMATRVGHVYPAYRSEVMERHAARGGILDTEKSAHHQEGPGATKG